MEELPLLQDGVRRGVILCREEGLHIRFSVSIPRWSSGLYKVWLVSARNRCLLGTLEPCGNSLVLERSMSIRSLRGAGVEPPERGELTVLGERRSEPALPAGWGNRRDMPLAIRDAVLKNSLASSPPGWYRRSRGGWLLAWRWNLGEELPVPSLACLGWSDRVEQIPCFLIRLKEDGWPWYKPSGTGKE